MKVFQLKSNPSLYCCNSYLLLGAWNTIGDINAIIDTGSDEYIIDEIENIYTGVGKKPVDRIVLTHNHFDHIGGAYAAKRKYNAKVYANILNGDLVDYIVKDGDLLKLAEHDFLVIHTPGHSTDSICLYNQQEQVLFSGDTNLQVRDSEGTYTPDYFDTLCKLSKLKIRTIYPGHGQPITENPEDMLRLSFKYVSKSIVDYKLEKILNQS